MTTGIPGGNKLLLEAGADLQGGGNDLGHIMPDLPLGGAIVPKEEVKKAALLKIEVRLPPPLTNVPG